MIRYGIWHDEREGDWCIVRWDDQSTSRDPWVRAGQVVQTGIRTRDKALVAQLTWERREAGGRVQ